MLIVISEDTFFETWKPTHAEEGPLADIPPGTDPACVWTDCNNGDGTTSIYRGEHFVVSATGSPRCRVPPAKNMPCTMPNRWKTLRS